MRKGIVSKYKRITESRVLSTYHILHVGCWRVHLTAQLVVQIKDEVHVSVTDGPPPPRPGSPPLLVLVLVLVQNGLKLRGVVQDHGHDSLGQTQKEARQFNPARERRRAPHGNMVTL